MSWGTAASTAPKGRPPAPSCMLTRPWFSASVASHGGLARPSLSILWTGRVQGHTLQSPMVVAGFCPLSTYPTSRRGLMGTWNCPAVLEGGGTDSRGPPSAVGPRALSSNTWGVGGYTWRACPHWDGPVGVARDGLRTTSEVSAAGWGFCDCSPLGLVLACCHHIYSQWGILRADSRWAEDTQGSGDVV